MSRYKEYMNKGKPVSILMENFVQHAPNPDFGPDGPDFWAFDEFLYLVETEPEKVWESVMFLLSKPEYRVAHGLFSAGPLEDVLSAHGDLLIERVETLAHVSPDFVSMLKGMYQFQMSDKVWERVQGAASLIPKHRIHYFRKLSNKPYCQFRVANTTVVPVRCSSGNAASSLLRSLNSCTNCVSLR